MQNADTMEDILFDTALIDEIGSKKSTIRVLEYYLEDSPKFLQDFEKLLSDRDLPNFIKKAHKLKGSLGMLKADLLVSLINQMEIAAVNEKNIDQLPDLLAALKAKLHILDEQIIQKIIKIKESL